MFDTLFTHTDLRVVGLATLVGGPAALATVFLVSRLWGPSAGWRRLWLMLAGLAAGAGVWATHFVAMLASQNGLPSGTGALAMIGGGLVLVTAIVGVGLDVLVRNGALRTLRNARDGAVEQARRAELAEDVARLGHWRLDLRTDQITWSRQMYRIYGLPDDAALDLRALIAMTHPDDARANAARLSDQRVTGVAHANTSTRIIDAEGSTRWLKGNSVGERDDGGALVAIVGTLVDVTDQHRLEEDLRAARAEAEAASAVKSEFLANMSHELRTPLTSILGFADLLGEQTDLSPNAQRYVARMHDASRALLCTVNDILDFSKLEAGHVTFQPRPMAPVTVARAALDLFTPQAGAKDLRLSLAGVTGDDLGVMLDPDRIRQILLNLVGNAVKFTAQGGVVLTVAYDREAQTLRFEVADTGVGIAPEKLGLLFQRFSQIDGGLSRAGGAGLGLAICKGLVEAMGGTIGVDSLAGMGSRFWFTVPALTADLPAAKTAAAAPADLSGARILVIDDQRANRELARLFLEAVGAEVTEGIDGTDGLGLAEALPYDLILTDFHMPGLNGPELLRAVRAGGGANDATPILAYTAEADDDVEARTADLGFDGLVRKPVTATELLGAIRAAIAPTALPQAPAAAHAR